ncbi:hypothetical protein B7494_g1615 [Chlorociboria aeruginascens]|nr:hypothetical protein B7494_g1615 [Chlorociboria aeruginascens]
MFEIDENDLPFVRTRQALLVLDIQNDLISEHYLAPVETPLQFIENTINLASAFRASGIVIWARSLFESSRPINGTGSESERVITDSQVLHRRKGKNRIITEEKGEASEPLVLEDGTEMFPETFLTVAPGALPQVLLPVSSGVNLAAPVLKAMDSTKDIIIQKTHYSAFKDGSLVQRLRSQFVTEIYICGALSNISVFATAMEAARHGYSITIVEDCLGYRSKARHDEALRQLVGFTGCDIISSGELIRDLLAKQKAAARRLSEKNSRPDKTSGLEGMMSNLELKDRSASRPVLNPAESAATVDSAKMPRPLQSSTPPAKDSQSPVDEAQRDRVKSKVRARRRLSKSESAPLGKQNTPSKTNGSESSAPAGAFSIADQKLLKSTEKPPSSENPKTVKFSDQTIVEHNKVTVGEEEPAHSTLDETIIENDLAVDAEHNDPMADQEIEEEHETAGEEMPYIICEGDTTIIRNLLPDELLAGIFEKVRDEVRWQTMSHQGGDVPRLVAVQGEIAEDGSIPVYRHPADESPPLLPFSASVSLIRKHVEERLGHPVNHVLIQFYRNGTDYISEHSDKTLDIVPKTFIANVSLGAQRTMVFRTKKSSKTKDPLGTVNSRETFRASLPHNSVCQMGLVTNQKWLHGIRQDKRMPREKSKAELSFEGSRISLTFRLIGTFLDKDQQKIWGQGAVSKSKDKARAVINGDTPEFKEMLIAFGKENHESDFDWKKSYGQGFDVLHMSNTRKLFLSGDEVADLRVKVMLAEYSIEWTEGKLSPSFNWKNGSSSKDAKPIPEVLPVKFVDNDLSKSIVTGDLAIMLYLEAIYGPKANLEARSTVDNARQFTRLQQTANLLDRWRAVPFSVKPFRREAEIWDCYAAEAPFIAGFTFSLADVALIPILEELAKEWGDCAGLPALSEYRKRMLKRKSIIKSLVEENSSKDSVARHHSTIRPSVPSSPSKLTPFTPRPPAPGLHALPPLKRLLHTHPLAKPCSQRLDNQPPPPPRPDITPHAAQHHSPQPLPPRTRIRGAQHIRLQAQHRRSKPAHGGAEHVDMPQLALEMRGGELAFQVDEADRAVERGDEGVEQRVEQGQGAPGDGERG